MKTKLETDHDCGILVRTVRNQKILLRKMAWKYPMSKINQSKQNESQDKME